MQHIIYQDKDAEIFANDINLDQCDFSEPTEDLTDSQNTGSNRSAPEELEFLQDVEQEFQQTYVLSPLAQDDTFAILEDFPGEIITGKEKEEKDSDIHVDDETPTPTPSSDESDSPSTCGQESQVEPKLGACEKLARAIEDEINVELETSLLSRSPDKKRRDMREKKTIRLTLRVLKRVFKSYRISKRANFPADVLDSVYATALALSQSMPSLNMTKLIAEINALENNSKASAIFEASHLFSSAEKAEFLQIQQAMKGISQNAHDPSLRQRYFKLEIFKVFTFFIREDPVLKTLVEHEFPIEIKKVYAEIQC